MKTASERRIEVRDQYRSILGRNKYSQDLRNYCFIPYSDGKYYSDCSSSISYCYKQAGESFGILNTVGMYTSNKLIDVPVIIKDGIIQNPEVLRIGDMLLFAGKDLQRKPYDYVGHVEMIGEINDNKYTLYGHGSGNPKKQDMNTYCKKRYNSKTSTPLGRALLLKVRRKILDDSLQNNLLLTPGETSANVKEMQLKLLKWDAKCLPKYGADGNYGKETSNALIKFQTAYELEPNGFYTKEVDEKLTQITSIIETPRLQVKIIGATVNIRSGPGTNYAVITVVKKDTTFSYLNETTATGWLKIDYNGREAWVRNTMATLI